MNDRRDPDRNLESELRAALDEEAQRAPLMRPEWDDQPYVIQAETRNPQARSSVVAGAAAAGILVATLAFAVVSSGDPGTDIQSITADVDVDQVEADEDGDSSPEDTSTSETSPSDTTIDPPPTDTTIDASTDDPNECHGAALEAIAVSPDGSTATLDGPIEGAAPGGTPLERGQGAVHWTNADGMTIELRYKSSPGNAAPPTVETELGFGETAAEPLHVHISMQFTPEFSDCVMSFRVLGRSGVTLEVVQHDLDPSAG